MNNTLVIFRRKFQVWSYSVSHGQLLLRSTKDSLNITQVDLLFKNVSFMSIPTAINEISVHELKQEDLKGFTLNINEKLMNGKRLFRVIGDNDIGIIIAGNIIWCEDASDYYSESKLLI